MVTSSLWIAALLCSIISCSAFDENLSLRTDMELLSDIDFGEWLNSFEAESSIANLNDDGFDFLNTENETTHEQQVPTAHMMGFEQSISPHYSRKSSFATARNEMNYGFPCEDVRRKKSPPKSSLRGQELVEHCKHSLATRPTQGRTQAKRERTPPTRRNPICRDWNELYIKLAAEPKSSLNPFFFADCLKKGLLNNDLIGGKINVSDWLKTLKDTLASLEQQKSHFTQTISSKLSSTRHQQVIDGKIQQFTEKIALLKQGIRTLKSHRKR